MKKLIFLSSLFLSFSSLVHAQWTTNGTVTSTTNSIGIGTTSPGASLSLGASTNNKKLFIYDTGIEASGLAQGYSEFRIFGVSSGTNHISLGKYNLANDSFLEQMRIDNSGNVGIGTTTPQTKLEVNGGISAYGSESHFSSGTYVDPVPGKAYDIKIGTNGIAVNGYSVFNNGISIGTTSLPSGYSFSVNGSAIATSVTVKLNSAWPDYVFKKDYQLPSLQEVKAYIDQNQHLPEIPSEQQIAKEGLNLGEMNKLLMKKVEELTLYLIEKDKEKEEQAAINRELINRINNLEKNLKH